MRISANGYPVIPIWSIAIFCFGANRSEKKHFRMLADPAVLPIGIEYSEMVVNVHNGRVINLGKEKNGENPRS